MAKKKKRKEKKESKKTEKTKKKKQEKKTGKKVKKKKKQEKKTETKGKKEKKGKKTKKKIEELIILGSGCAGMTAAIYAARADLEPLLLAGPEKGGQLIWTTKVENYPGFPEGIDGTKLTELFRKQAERFGTKVIDDKAVSFEAKKTYFNIGTEKESFKAKAVIIATGARAKMLGLKSEQKYFGRGVSTCASCDAYFFKGKDVVVVGGGDSACTEALFMAKLDINVTIIHRRDKLRASKIMQERVFKNKKIEMIWDSVVEEVLGDGTMVTGVKIKNVKTGKTKKIKCAAMFLAIGHKPNTEIFKDKIKMDNKGFIIAEDTKTNIKGVFAAGDVQDPVYKQAVTAAGSGCKAALEAEGYLAESKQ
ncbi:thioredoxin-disulfide reductase [Candidatus Woesearchaeota archaeon]|nr:thioredoxin-disulfide reductase [Candidatus Woesearchaeota archaeon]